MPGMGIGNGLWNTVAALSAVSVAAPTSTFTMTQLASPNRVYQRATTSGGGQGKGQGSIAVTISSATGGTINARCRSAADGTTILQAEWAAATIATSATSATISGVDARLGWFYLDLKDSSGTWKNGTTAIGMGRVIAISGQSLAARMFTNENIDTTNTNASQSISIDPNCSVYGLGDNQPGNSSIIGWAAPADGTYTTTYNSCFASEYLRLQVAASGVNCAQVGYAVGSTSITYWISGGTGVAPLHTVLAAVGGFEAFIWMQGHSDSLAGMSSATYQADLTTFFTDMAAQNTVRGASFEKYLASIPNTTNIISWGTAAQINVIRNAQATWAAGNSATYVQPNDLAEADGVHENQIGAVALARHFYRASRPVFGLTHDDTGPTISSVARTTGSNVVKLTISLPSGASALASVGSPSTRFLVASKGDLTKRPITSLSIVSSTEIDLTLTQTPPDNVPLDVWFGCPPAPVNDGSADMVYDNNTDSDGLATGRHVNVTLSPLAAAAPVPSLGPTLTSHSAAFGTWPEAAFANALTGGYGSAAAVLGDDILPWATIFTAECRFLRSAAPTSGNAYMGGNGFVWMYVDTSGFLHAVYNSTTLTYSVNVCDGSPHHVELGLDASGAILFLDGTSVATNAAKYTPSTTTSIWNLGTWQSNALKNFSIDGGGSVTEWATWTVKRHSSNFTAPTAPYVGNEANLYALYHLHSSLASG